MENASGGIEALAADAWNRWPMKTAAGDAARRSHMRAQLSGEMTYQLVERYDAARGGTLLALIERVLADSEPPPPPE
jgi:hypothetical protein